MKIELKDHNKETFFNVCDLFKTNNRVAVEQATGTGKSYVTSHTIATLSKARTLYLTSGITIINEFKKSADMNAIVDMTRIDFLTYQGTLFVDLDSLREKYDFIVLDEYHRVGAKKWYSAVMNILDALPEAKVLGTTATPIRYLDNKRNMTEELFDNVIANTITLSDALENSILVKPKYIMGVYEYNFNSLFEKSFSNTKIQNKIKYLTNNFDNTFGVISIFKKHITNERKFVVFCESTEHLNKMMSVVTGWFKDSFNESVNTYCVHSNKSNSQSDLELFKNSKEGFNLLFVINMLNEGIHIDVDGLLFLRSTKSAILYYQQLGRALTATQVNPPLIFDFVRNPFHIMKLNYDKDNNKSNTKGIEKSSDIDYSILGHFDVFDETINFRDILQELELHTSSWMEKYKLLVEFKIKHGHLDIPYKYTVLYRFLRLQKIKYNKGELEYEKIQLLNGLNIDWCYTTDAYEIQWLNRLKELSTFVSVNGHHNIPRSEKSLYKFLSKQRSLYAKERLSESRIKDLTDLGFNLESTKVKSNDSSKKMKSGSNISTWDINFEELLEFKSQFGHCNVPRSYTNKTLAEWVHTQRSNKDTMTSERKEKLISIGFEFNLAEKLANDIWETMFKKLVEFKYQFGHCRVSSRYSDQKLANWVRTQRRRYKDNKLDEYRYKKLVDLDFTF